MFDGVAGFEEVLVGFGVLGDCGGDCAAEEGGVGWVKVPEDREGPDRHVRV